SVASTSAPATLVVHEIGDWHGVALTMLAAGTLIFLGLFVWTMERGGSLQVESHWGGIGGGLGGWRASASLAYLLAAIAFGVLFAFFVIRLDRPPSSDPKATQPQAAAETGKDKSGVPAKTNEG